MLQPDISLINKVLQHIGCSESHKTEQLQNSAQEALNNVFEKADFKYRYCKIADLPTKPTFLYKDVYAAIQPFLLQAALFAGTLGLACDKAIKTATKANLSQAVMLNAAANIVLEELVNQTIKTIQPQGVLFCPGYSGSDIRDNEEILNYLNAKKLIGIYTAESGIMIPEKSMCGILLDNYHFSCKGCFIQSKCKYIKLGTTCYNQ